MQRQVVILPPIKKTKEVSGAEHKSSSEASVKFPSLVKVKAIPSSESQPKPVTPLSDAAQASQAVIDFKSDIDEYVELELKDKKTSTEPEKKTSDKVSQAKQSFFNNCQGIVDDWLKEYRFSNFSHDNILREMCSIQRKFFRFYKHHKPRRHINIVADKNPLLIEIEITPSRESHFHDFMKKIKYNKPYVHSEYPKNRFIVNKYYLVYKICCYKKDNVIGPLVDKKAWESTFR